jgi:hypothetical protein
MISGATQAMLAKRFIQVMNQFATPHSTEAQRAENFVGRILTPLRRRRRAVNQRFANG